MADRATGAASGRCSAAPNGPRSAPGSGLLDLIPTADEHDADRAPRAGHHGRRLRPVGRAGGRAPADRRPERHVGAALLDQTTVAGIGTMYMAEALFVQKVSPWTPIGEVDVPALLATARRQLLRGATQAKPTTTGNPRRGHGELGARPVRPAVPAVRDDRSGGDDRATAEGAHRLLLPDVPTRPDAHRRRQAAEPAGFANPSSGEEPRTGRLPPDLSCAADRPDERFRAQRCCASGTMMTGRQSQAHHHQTSGDSQWARPAGFG